MGPLGGTPWWDPKVGPQGGTPRWYPKVVPLGGTPRLDPKVGPQGGTPSWDPKVGPLGGTPKVGPQGPGTAPCECYCSSAVQFFKSLNVLEYMDAGRHVLGVRVIIRKPRSQGLPFRHEGTIANISKRKKDKRRWGRV